MVGATFSKSALIIRCANPAGCKHFFSFLIFMRYFFFLSSFPYFFFLLFCNIIPEYFFWLLMLSCIIMCCPEVHLLFL